MADYTEPPKIAESALPKVESMTDVTHLRTIGTTDSESIAKENVRFPATQITASVVGITATDVNGALAEHQADIETLGTEKVSTTTQVIAGAGLTGGGALGTSRTLDVEAMNDSIAVAADGISVAVATLAGTSATKPPNEASVVAALALKENIVDIYNVTGAVSHYKRVLADAGGVLDRTWLLRAYEEYIKQRPETVRLYIPELGAKLRTSGLNRFGVKAYDMSANAKDAVQATDATQPYMTVGAAPNARFGMRFVQGQTQTGLMDFDDVVFAAGASWTLTKRVKINSKGTGRVYLGAAYIAIGASTIVLHSGTVAVLTGTYNFEAGRTYTIEFQYSNGVGLIMVNGFPIATTPLSGAVTFGQISYSTAYPADRAIYAFHLTNTRKSAYQSALDHTFLSTLFPDMESVVIGNQVWSTDNFCGTVAGDGTVVSEVQGATTDGNVELITNAADREFSSDTGWWTLFGEATISGGTGNIISTGGGESRLSRLSLLTVGKLYRLTYDVVSNTAGALRLDGNITVLDSIVGTSKVVYFIAASANFIINRSSGITNISIDNISVKEVGAADATNIYNTVYAATTGTAAVKDLAATKAAAMWCHYDNLVTNGAIYGKLYNWYAVHLFDLYPPVKGWRVPSQLDFDQLVANQGGSTVAGGKLKAKFGGFNNVNASNESGFSAIAGGRRTSGGFQLVGDEAFMWDTTNHNRTASHVTSFSAYGNAKDTFASLRLLRNEPAGDNEKSYTSGLFTTDITSVAKQIPISFGRIENAIRIKSENSLTAIEAKLHNVVGTAVATLITGKTIGAGETKMFAVTADWVSLLQDGTIRVTAAGNSGAAVGMEIEVLTHKGVLS